MKTVVIFILFFVNIVFAARIVDDMFIDLSVMEREEPEYICKDSPVDISFIIDSSRSIYTHDFTRQIEFLVKFVTIFDIQPAKVRVAAISFGQQVIRQGSFYFNKYNSTKEVQRGLRGIKYRGEEYGLGTNTGMAIAYVRKWIFKSARPEAKKLCIILTDGRSTNTRKTQEEAALIKRENVQMVAIGIGDNISMEELKGIASSSDLVFTVENHSLLETIKRRLVFGICKDVEIVTVKPPVQNDDNKVHTTTAGIPFDNTTKHKDQITTTASPPSNNKTNPINKKKGCHDLLDINFVFNPSDVGARRIIKFIENTVTSKTLANDDVRVGIITVPFPDINGFRLNRYKNKADIKKHFDEFGVNQLSPQLYDLRLKAFLSSNGGRANARQIGVVFLKGKVDDYFKAVIQAKDAHADGIEIYVISIGRSNAKIVVNHIASNADHVIYVSTSNELLHLSGEFLRFMCDE